MWVWVGVVEEGEGGGGQEGGEAISVHHPDELARLGPYPSEARVLLARPVHRSHGQGQEGPLTLTRTLTKPKSFGPVHRRLVE